MKNITIYILALLVLGCNNIDEVLKQSDDINVILLETTSLPVGNPGDTISFKVLATTNDIIKRMELTDKSHDFEPLGGKIRFEIVDTISIDDDGYFNRDVRSIVVNYPILLTDVTIGDTLAMRFSFTTDKGVRSSVKAQAKVGNYIYNSVKMIVGGHPQAATGGRFYSALGHKPYTEDVYQSKKDSVDVVVFSYQGATPNEYTIRFMSPGSPKTQEQFGTMINASLVNYDYTTMRHTKFIKVDIPWMRVGDEEIRQLDFTNATDVIDVAPDDRIGFMTEEGRKGVILGLELIGFKIPLQTKIQKFPEQ